MAVFVVANAMFPMLVSKVSGFIALLNCICIVVLSGTLTVLFAGVMDTIVGFVKSTPGAVVKVLVVVPTIVFPTKSFTPTAKIV